MENLVNDVKVIIQVDESSINPYNAEIFLHKLWKPKRFFQFEIIKKIVMISN